MSTLISVTKCKNVIFFGWQSVNQLFSAYRCGGANHFFSIYERELTILPFSMSTQCSYHNIILFYIFPEDDTYKSVSEMKINWFVPPHRCP